MLLPPARRVLFVAVAALAVRCALFSTPHSGAGRPPLWGDLEAQRHWMEVTSELPLPAWYVHSHSNDLQYWGLDYPPLTAYHSWVAGAVAQRLLPALVAWETSRGIETGAAKLFMRMTVLLVDALVYAPAVAAYAALLKASSRGTELPATLALALSPALLLVDHAHFQYNCVCLGFTLAFVVLTLRGAHYAAAAAFTLALNYKQMALYFAPAVFVHFLALAASGRMGVHPALAVARVGAVVVLVFGLLWSPFCVLGYMQQGACLPSLLAVLTRLFPVSRGLFEGKVANLWCVLEPALRLRAGIMAGSGHSWVLLLCAGAVGALMAPSLLALWRSSMRAAVGLRRPLLLTLFTCSLSFFLAAYQVHEKSILLPALPMAALAGDFPHLAHAFGLVAVWSLWPLASLDRNLPAAVALTLLHALVMAPSEDGPSPEAALLARWARVSLPTAQRGLTFALRAEYGAMAALALASAALPPPSFLPDLHSYLNAVLSAGVLALSWAAGTALAWQEADGEQQQDKTE